MSGRGRLVFGLLFVVMGALIMLAGFGYGPFAASRSPGVAVWAAVAAGVCFVAAGFAVMFEHRPAIAELFGFATALSLAVVGNWVAFGPGTRACTLSLVGLFDAEWVTNGLACRALFGWGAMTTNVFVLLLALRLAANDLGEAPWLKRARKGAEWLMLAVLSPLLLALLILALLGGGGQTLREKFARRFGRGGGGDSPSK